MSHPVVLQYLATALLLFMLCGSAIGVVIGLGLILRSAQTLRLLEGMNRWVSTRRLLKPLEEWRDTGSAVRRNRRPFGIALVLAGGYVVYSLLTSAKAPMLAKVLGIGLVGGILLEATWWLLVIGSAFAIVVGLLLVFAPAVAESLETAANRWTSSRRAVPGGADRMYLQLDRVVQRHPRAAGCLIALFSLLVAAEILYIANRPLAQSL